MQGLTKSQSIHTKHAKYLPRISHATYSQDGILPTGDLDRMSYEEVSRFFTAHFFNKHLENHIDITIVKKYIYTLSLTPRIEHEGVQTSLLNTP